jgi:hypothetical protein
MGELIEEETPDLSIYPQCTSSYSNEFDWESQSWNLLSTFEDEGNRVVEWKRAVCSLCFESAVDQRGLDEERSVISKATGTSRKNL